MQESYDKKGYVILPFLTKSQINELLDLYDENINHEEVSGLYESGRENDYDTNLLINDAIRHCLRPAFDKYFVNANLFGGTFMVKSCRDSEELPLHQDWSVVDEDKHQTALIWCPLVDVKRENGCLFLIEESHHYFQTLRSGSLPSKRYPLSSKYDKYRKDIPLKAGQAILYSDRLFHGSYANQTNKNRVTILGRVVEDGASLVYCHQRKEGVVEIFETDGAFYIEYAELIARGEVPDHVKPTYTRPYVHREIKIRDLERKIKAQHGGRKLSWIKKWMH